MLEKAVESAFTKLIDQKISEKLNGLTATQLVLLIIIALLLMIVWKISSKQVKNYAELPGLVSELKEEIKSSNRELRLKVETLHDKISYDISQIKSDISQIRQESHSTAQKIDDIDRRVLVIETTLGLRKAS